MVHEAHRSGNGVAKAEPVMIEPKRRVVAQSRFCNRRPQLTRSLFLLNQSIEWPTPMSLLDKFLSLTGKFGHVDGRSMYAGRC